MLGKKKKGEQGERKASLYLEERGYSILERNWKFSRAEIDIIAKQKDILVFVEVKTRSSVHFGQPEDFVSQNQKWQIIDAATQYMREKNYEWAFRFDIISVFQRGNQTKINHFEDAFFPGLEGI